MMTIRVVIFSIFFFPLFVQAQEATYTIADTAKARVLLEDAQKLLHNRILDTALIQVKKAKEIYSNTLGEQTAEVAECFDKIGLINKRNLDFQTSIESYQNSLAIRTQIFGDSALIVGETYTELGNVYDDVNQLEKALSCHEISLAIKKIHLKETDIEIAKEYSNVGGVFVKMRNAEKALSAHNNAIAIFSQLDDSNFYVSRSYNSIGVLFLRLGKLRKAIEYYRKSIALKLEIPNSNELELVNPYFNLGAAYTAIGDYNNGILYTEKVLNILKRERGEDFIQVSYAYDVLGSIYFQKSNFKKAIQYNEKALDILIKNHRDDKHLDFGYNYNYIGMSLNELGEYERAIEYLKKSVAIKKQEGRPMDLATTYNNIGGTYKNMGRYKEAIDYHEKSFTIVKESMGTEEHIGGFYYYSSLGVLYGLLNEHEQAIGALRRGLEIGRLVLGEKNQEVARVHNYLAQQYCVNHNYEKAREQYTIAMEVLNYQSIKDLEIVTSISGLLESFRIALEININENFEKQDLSLLHRNKELFENTTSALEYEFNVFGYDGGSQLFDLNSQINALGISIHQSLYNATDSLHYSKQCFNFSERTKSYQLYSTMKDADALVFANIPEDLLNKEYGLRSEISNYEKQKQNLLSEGRPPTDSLIVDSSGKLFKLKREEEALKSQLERDYPDYYNLKYNFSTVSVEEVQTQLLTENQTLLEYFVADSSVYIFVLNKDDFHIEEIKKDFPLEAWVSDFRTANDAKFYTQKSRQYTESAYQLYQKLIAPVQEKLKEKLIIIPDGVLGYIPFEALLAEPALKPVRFRQHHYLLRDKQISYAYSATLLQQMRNKQHKSATTEGLLAFAPYYDGDTTALASLFRYAEEEDKAPLKPLPNSGEEVYGIQKLVGGKVYYHQEATEARFWEEAKNYRFLHLATHGKANDKTGDYSFLAFTEQKDSIENELLFVRDLYNLQLNADMVVLSACETGIGELQRGEGIISLARGFTYAGAKSIFTTLWSVQDESSKDLMLLFYKHLKAGMPKDKALRQAKLDYLDSLDSNPLAHPFHWSGFIGIGDMSPVKF